MSLKHQPGYMPHDRTGNRVLVQSSLGKSKPTNYNIPQDNFVYGVTTVQDPQHVNELIYTWKYHQNSKNPNIGKQKDLIKTNKDCIKNLLHTAKDFYGFRQTATSFKQPKEGSNILKIKLPQQGFTYGKPLELEDPIKLVLANNYGIQDGIARKTFYDTKSQKAQEQKKKLSFYKTKNHNIKREATLKKMFEMQMAIKGHGQHWKLKEFGNVTTKLDTRRKPFDTKPQQDAPVSQNRSSRIKSSLASSKKF